MVSLKIRSLQIGKHVLIVACSCVMLLPFAWMLSTSLKTQPEVFVYPIKWIPDKLIWSNYGEVLAEKWFFGYFVNSVNLTVWPLLGKIATSSLAAFAFAKLRFPGRDMLFLLYLGTLMVPMELTLIPNYILMKELGLLGSHLSIILPGMFTAFGVFVLRQAMIVIPNELLEAARIDGAGYARAYMRIVMPLCRPSIAALAIFIFIGQWNSFLLPLIYLQTQDKYPLTIGLYNYIGQYATNYPLLMAASVLMLLPTVLFFSAANRQFIQGVAMTGIKG